MVGNIYYNVMNVMDEISSPSWCKTGYCL